MDHAEAHERLGDLALEPGRLAGLDHDTSPETADLRAHVGTCEECRAELASLQQTDAAIRDAFAAATEAAPPAILRPTAGLRDRVLAAAAADRTPLTPAPTTPVVAVRRPFSRIGGWLSLGLAAALVLAIGLGGVLSQRLADLSSARVELAEMTEAVAMLDRILAAEKHVTVPLQTADGSPGGIIAWTRTEVVVLSTSLDRPPDGREYVCWMEEAGNRWRVGEMHFSGTTAYWAGPLEDWNASFAPGNRFGVSLSPPAGGEPLPVLIAEF
jgi:hypothetical protein